MLQSLTFRGFRIGFGIGFGMGFGIGFQIQNMILSKTVLLHAVEGVRARRPDIKMISAATEAAHNISTQNDTAASPGRRNGGETDGDPVCFIDD